VIVAGCDVGSRTGKVVIMSGGEILASSIVLRSTDAVATARAAMQQALAHAALSMADLQYVVGTGWGKLNIPFARQMITEIASQSRGANWIDPAIRTVIAMGGQDCKVLRVDGRGIVSDYVNNDKCASGTGRFMEDIARVLGLRLEDLGEISLRSESPVTISTQCSVFAKSEVVSLIAEKKAVTDIVAGIHAAIVSRLLTLLHRLGIEEKLILSGGVGKNVGLVQRLEERLGIKLVKPAVDPQLIGALGAALAARHALQGEPATALMA